MKWDVYKNGKVIGQVDAFSPGNARRKAFETFKYAPGQGEVAMVDDSGPGLYQVTFTARSLGAEGIYNMSVGGTIEAASAHEAMEKIRQENQDVELGTPVSIDFIPQ